jgi:ankyrin repeat protein
MTQVKDDFSAANKNKPAAGALVDAVERGAEEEVKGLLESGADVNDRSDEGWTSLMLASFWAKRGIVDLLLDHNADVNARGEKGETSLIWAAREGHNSIVELLIENGADVDAREENGKTALIYAAMAGYDDMVHVLCWKGANLDDRDNKEKSAMDYAVAMNQQPAVKALNKQVENRRLAAEKAIEDEKQRLADMHDRTAQKQKGMRSRKRQVRIDP